jgi:hypothetical protein
MTADELRKWYQFKGMKQSDKRSREAATVSADLLVIIQLLVKVIAVINHG